MGDNVSHAAATLATSPGQLQEPDLESLLPTGVRKIDPAAIEIGDFIARGGFAEVYKGVWTHSISRRALSPRAIAAKRFDAFSSLNVKTKNMFLKEVQTMAEFRHQNLVTLHGILQKGPSAYIIMDLMYSDLDRILHGAEDDNDGDVVDGSTLLPAETVMRIVRNISEGMAHLEEHKMSHLDIKPQNIFSANAELTHFLVGDMGLSHKTNATLTRFSKSPVGGTMAYMAPEIISEENYGSPADVYSACVLFVEVITGQRPWEGSNPKVVPTRVMMGKRLPVPPCSERCPPFLADVIRQSFSASPEKPTERPKFCTIVQLLDKYEAAFLMKDRDKLAKLRENLLIAKASDSNTYTAIWQNMTNDDIASAKTLSSTIKRLTESVAGNETPP